MLSQPRSPVTDPPPTGTWTVRPRYARTRIRNRYPKSRHHSVRQFPYPTTSQHWRPSGRQTYDHVSPADPFSTASARSRYREDFAHTLDLDDQDDIQARVAQLVTTSLAPLGNPHGKRLFAHYYVRRAKRTRSSLGELSIPEYTYGFLCLINSPETFAHDKPFMLKHLSNLNEDATTYEWPGVKNWSEEVCALIAQGDLTWDDDYKIDFMRLKFSQQFVSQSLIHSPRTIPSTLRNAWRSPNPPSPQHPRK